MRLVHDPGGVYLRTALRAAVLVPVLYAVLGPIEDATAALYAAFASFSALVFADFQGTTRRRLEAYGALAVLGAVLVVLGSLAADQPVVSAVALFAATFAIRYAGCLGGYAVAVGTTLLLAFSLAILTTPVVDVDQRVLGWLVGCVAAGLATLVAPLPLHYVAVDPLAAQCRSLANRMRDLRAGRPAPDVDHTVVRQVREDLARSPGRPLDATASQTALALLLDAVGRATMMCERLPDGSPLGDAELRTDELADVTADTFDAAALAIAEQRPVDLAPVHAALAAQRERMVAVMAGDDPRLRARAVDEATTTMRLRFVAALSGVVAAAAATWRGHRPSGEVLLDAGAALPEPGPGPFWARARRTLASHLRWGSTRVRNALRAGLALTAALLVARWVRFDHGFWVVLGALMVLRSDVNDTTTTALQALRGTLIGFALAAGIAWAAGGDDVVLWVVLPVSVFAAAWAPRAIGLGSGQAAFTVFVVTLFNLATPEGAQTAVVRLATVATGIGVALVAGFLFWPRGPKGRIGPAAAALYRAAGASVRAVSADSLGLPSGRAELEPTRRDLRIAREQLDETLEELVAAHRSHVALADRVAVTTPPAVVRAGEWARADLALGTIGPDEGSTDTPSRDLEAAAFEVSERFAAVASQLADRDAPPVPMTAPATGEPPGAEGLDGPQYLRQVWLWTWLTTVDQSLRATQAEAVATIRGLPRRWWR